MNYHYKMEELLPVVGRLAERYNAWESTSVTYEKAEQLMGAVLYCIRELGYAQRAAAGSEGAEHSTHELAQSQEKLSAQQAYERGLVCVENKVKAALLFYNELMAQFDSYGNRCLYDTMVKGMPEFFRRYDMRYAPQDTILTLDYPVRQDLTRYTGVDRIYEYLICIGQEQEFLRSMPRAEVLDRLLRYDPQYEDMIDNICAAVEM